MASFYHYPSDDFYQKYPKASPFQNKGWPYYNSMMSLMPTTAKGLNVFHPGQVVPDNKHDDVSGPSRDLETNEEPDVEAGIGHIESHGQTPVEDVDRGDELIHWLPTPPPRNCSPSSPIVNYKCQHLAISSGTASITSTVLKKCAISSTSAVHRLTAELSAFGDTFLEGIAMAVPKHLPLHPYLCIKPRQFFVHKSLRRIWMMRGSQH